MAYPDLLADPNNYSGVEALRYQKDVMHEEYKRNAKKSSGPEATEPWAEQIYLPW